MGFAIFLKYFGVYLSYLKNCRFGHSVMSLEKNNITLFMTLGKITLHKVQFVV